jgi:hypothetical protein
MFGMAVRSYGHAASAVLTFKREGNVSLNGKVITEAIWRQLPSGLRTALRQALQRKSAIVGRQVLDIAQALCERGAYGLAFDLYQVLDGRPLMPL